MSISFYSQVYHQIHKIYLINELPTPQAMLLSFLAGPINLRNFVATRPEGTRQPNFWVHYPTRPEVEKSLPVRAWAVLSA